MIILTRSLWLITLLLAWSGAAQALLIDNFNVAGVSNTSTSLSSSGTSNSATRTGLNSAQTVGGIRETTISNNGSNSGQSLVEITTGVASITHVNNLSGLVNFVYDGNSAGVGNLNLDLTADGSVRFQINIKGSIDNIGTGLITLSLFDGINTTFATVSTSGTAARSLYIPYVEFSNSSFNFASVNSIQVFSQASQLADGIMYFAIDEILTSIPEPSTLLLFGGAGLLWLFRRRQQTATQSLIA